IMQAFNEVALFPLNPIPHTTLNRKRFKWLSALNIKTIQSITYDINRRVNILGGKFSKFQLISR
ncbi:hypothetical protein AB6D08_26130, partial [Vibrio splendidus]